MRLLTIIAALILTQSAVADYATKNFTVKAPTDAEAKAVGDAAEEFRVTIAEFWFGERLPNWSRPCSINVRSGVRGNGGSTGFRCVDGQCTGWQMTLQGTSEAIVDSVLPHEIQHTIFASHYGQYLPRWLDEGAATLFETETEKAPHIGTLRQVAKSNEWVPLSSWVARPAGAAYPPDGRKTAILYAEGYGVVDYLVQLEGPEVFVAFVRDGIRGDWSRAFRTHYRQTIAEVDGHVREWTQAGNPDIHAVRTMTTARRTGVTSALYFTQPAYCAPCRQMESTFEALEQRFEFTRSEEYKKHNVTNIPAVIFYRDGEEVSRLVGLQSQATIESMMGRTVNRPIYPPPSIFGGYPRGYKPPRFKQKYKSSGVGIGVGPIGIGVGGYGYACEIDGDCHTGTLDCPVCYPQQPTQPKPPVTTRGPQGPPGEPGRDGANGRDAVVDYEAIIRQIVENMPQPRDGVDGRTGPAGPRGPAGPPGQGVAVDLTEVYNRLEVLERGQRVVLTSDGVVQDDETYLPGEPIVLDLKKLTRQSGTK